MASPLQNVLKILLLIAILLLALDALPIFEIKSEAVKMMAYTTLIASPFLVNSKCINISHSGRKRVAMNGFLWLLSGVGFALLVHFSIFTPVWKVQTIVYQHMHQSNKRIEFQLLDVGALGYRSREVQVTDLTSLFRLVSPVPINIDIDKNWEKVNKHVNELGLNGG